MKFKGETLAIHEYTTITLERKMAKAVTLRVNAIPLGLKRDFETMCPRPKPPFRMVSEKGKSDRKDENYDDPHYIEDVLDYRDLERYYILYVALKGNPDLEFDAAPTDISSLKRFREEIKAAGFSEGDAKVILDASMAASNISNEDVNKARENF